MEISYKTKAIILKREPYLEDNSRVFVYTDTFGRLELIARGTQKLTSKLAAHLEPLNVCEIMVLKGKQYDYIGSAVSEEVFTNIKNYYNRLQIASYAVSLVIELIKDKERDVNIFLMIQKFLEVLDGLYDDFDKNSLQLLKISFTIKLIAMLGYMPDFSDWQIGENRINANIAKYIEKLLNIAFNDVLTLDIVDDLPIQLEDVVRKYKLYIFD